MYTSFTVVQRRWSNDGGPPVEISQKFTVVHNGDWSGNVEITGEIDIVDQHSDGRVRIEIPSDLLVQCVGEMVRSYRIERLENLDSRSLVTLPPHGT